METCKLILKKLDDAVKNGLEQFVTNGNIFWYTYKTTLLCSLFDAGNVTTVATCGNVGHG